MDTINLGKYLEESRTARKISRSSFLNGIISERQYRRYLKGENEISFATIALLVERLGMDFSSFYSNFNYSSNQVRNKIYDIYALVRNRNYKQALDEIDLIGSDYGINDSSRKTLDICSIISKKELFLMSGAQANSKIKEIINYPKILIYKELTFFELFGLLTISDSELKSNKESEIPNFLYNIIKDDILNISTIKANWVPSILFNIARMLGIQEKNEEVINVCDIAVKFCLKHEIFNSLAHIYYISAVAYKNLDEDTKSIESVDNMMDVIKIEKNEEKKKYFLELINKHIHKYKFN